MNLLKDVSVGKNVPDEINVIVENVKGSNNKIEYDKDECVFKLDRVLYSAVFWPFDYGFLPQTWHDDDDPVDVVLLTSYPTMPGCVVKARPVGLILMEDEAGIDDKIIAVPVKDPRFSGIKSLKDIPQHTLKEMQEFFETYKRLEPGKMVKFKKFDDIAAAKKVVEEGIKSYKKKFR